MTQVVNERYWQDSVSLRPGSKNVLLRNSAAAPLGEQNREIGAIDDSISIEIHGA